MKVRIVLDPRERHDFARLSDLADTVRIKRGGPFDRVIQISLAKSALVENNRLGQKGDGGGNEGDFLYAAGGGGVDVPRA